QELTVSRPPLRIAGSKVTILLSIVLQIKEHRPVGIDLMDQLPAPVAQSNETERVVGAEKRHARLIVQQRLPLEGARNRQAEEIENGRRGVDKTGDALDLSRLPNQAGRDDNVG